ncbi:MAG: energy transducer TonB [Neisseriaceae bacterium]
MEVWQKSHHLHKRENWFALSFVLCIHLLLLMGIGYLTPVHLPIKRIEFQLVNLESARVATEKSITLKQSQEKSSQVLQRRRLVPSQARSTMQSSRIKNGSAGIPLKGKLPIHPWLSTSSITNFKTQPSSGEEAKQISHINQLPKAPVTVPFAEKIDIKGNKEVNLKTMNSGIQDTSKGRALQKGPTSPASILRQTEPTYPIESRRKGEAGSVRLRVEVLADGRKGDIQLVKSSGYTALDQAALNTVRKEYQFKPAMKDGNAIVSRVEFEVKFILK